MNLRLLNALRLSLSLSTAALVFGTFAMQPLAGQQRGRNTRSDSLARVVVLLDGYVQTRFEQDEGKFGLSRLMPPVNGHQTVWYGLPVANEREKEIMEAVRATRLEYLVEFVPCAHKPGNPTIKPIEPDAELEGQGITLVAARSSAAPFEPYSFSKARQEFRKTTEGPIHKEALSKLPRLKKGDTVDTYAAGWYVALRPVRASKTSCLTCHKGANAGDTLGIMLYAVRPVPVSAPKVPPGN